MLTVTSIANPTVLAKIDQAVAEAKRTGISQYVKNRKGRPFLRVVVFKGMVMYHAGNRNLFSVVKCAQKRIRG